MSDLSHRIDRLVADWDATGKVDEMEVTRLLDALVDELARLNLAEGYGLDHLVPPAKAAVGNLRRIYASRRKTR